MGDEHPERPTNPNTNIDGATWDAYQKTTATWAVKLPVDVTVRTSHGPVEAEGGDYLCISADGDLYPCSAETFEKQYEPSGPLEGSE
ncbi:ORF 9 [Haloarcula hispanica virus SH1]|uniref:ORF 9 n=1 Tax=Haloarcula hispanica SH1 virus TaxID=326574 RepID=Q4KPH8_9VIRU|nr:ORF 9 [Haloarcula hispanica virus SH1]AAY24935.1 ORF 9 [Haloarcula hispanica virus SH1]